MAEESCLRAALTPAAFPPKLARIVDFFAGLDEQERRENFIHWAGRAALWRPREGVTYDRADVRHDPECMDRVGIFLKSLAGGGVEVRMDLGPGVQTLTRALASVLCEGLDGESPAVLQNLDNGFVEQIVGAPLVRVRSRTVYYLIGRIRESAGGM